MPLFHALDIKLIICRKDETKMELLRISFMFVGNQNWDGDSSTVYNIMIKLQIIMNNIIIFSLPPSSSMVGSSLDVPCAKRLYKYTCSLPFNKT